MNLDISKIIFTNMEQKQNLCLPIKVSNNIAYLSGFIAGDGHLCWREKKKEYHIVCSGNLKKEQKFYNNVISPLFKKLFNIEMKIKIREYDNTYNLIYYSKSVVRFFSEVIGIPTGSKSDKIMIPELFLSSDDLTKNFIQGFADADFCISLKKRYKTFHYYPVITCSSKSKKIIMQITDFLKQNKFNVSTQFDTIIYDERFGYTITNSLNIYGHNQLIKWMEFIGFRNNKNIKIFELWKEKNKNNKWAEKAFESLKISSGEEI